jgi:putative ABC transport system permease protein
MGAIRQKSLNLTGFDFPERLDAAEVSAGFFRALGARCAAGRIFLPDEDQAGGHTQVALVSSRLWTSRFGRDPALVGRSLTLNGQPHTVVGVLDPGAPWLDAVDIFVPLVRTATPQRGSFELDTVGRLKSGVTLEAARGDLLRVARRLAEQYPDVNAGMGAAIAPSSTWIAGDTLRRALWLLMGAVAFLLLIACVNVANLLLARAAGRVRESALRTALGASRFHLVRQLLTESLVLATAGTVLGLGLAAGIVRAFQTMDPGGIPRLSEIAINGSVLGFTILVALVTTLATGLVPAAQTSAGDIASALREGERGTKGHWRQRRLREVLVGIEVAVSLMLLVGAGLLVRSLGQVLGVDRGFEAENRLVVSVSIPEEYGGVKATQILTDFLARVRVLPDVISAAAVSGRPLSDGSTGLGIGAAGRPDQGGEVPWATWRLVTADYFKTMGVPLLRGRVFTEHDLIARPWRAVVSKRVADLLWPGEDPIGRQMVLWRGQQSNEGEVIGVVGDMRERGLERDPTLAVYFPIYGTNASPQFVVHTRNAPHASVPQLRAILAGLDPQLPISNVRTLDELVARSVATRRFTMLLLGSLAVAALALALAGIAGVLAYSVSTRTAEIGVRLALGASARQVLGLVVAQGMRPVLAGMAVGLAGAAVLSRVMSNLLFGVTALDAATYGTVATALALVAVASCYLPARQVLHVDPVITLRSE